LNRRVNLNKKRKSIELKPALKASQIKYKFPKSIISTPSGRCPVVLANSEMIEVLNWANEVKETAGDTREYSLQAIQYWVRDFFPVLTEEWRSCLNILEENQEKLNLKNLLVKDNKKD